MSKGRVVLSFVKKVQRSMIQPYARDDGGFSVAELAMTVVILGILLGLGVLALTSTSQRNALKAAGLQVERAMSEAHSVAQNEKVTVTLNFYGKNSADEPIRNTYKILRGTPPTTTSMKPPSTVKYFSRVEGGSTHYYCRLSEGGSQLKISDDVEMFFVPRGAITRCEDGSGNAVTRTVTLQYGGLPDMSISVNSEGRVTIS